MSWVWIKDRRLLLHHDMWMLTRRDCSVWIHSVWIHHVVRHPVRHTSIWNYSHRCCRNICTTTSEIRIICLLLRVAIHSFRTACRLPLLLFTTFNFTGGRWL